MVSVPASRPALAGLIPALFCAVAAAAPPGLPDGALDPGFGRGGQTTTDFPINDDLPSAVAVQPDGKIVVAGMGGDTDPPQYDLLKCRILRFDRDGRLDPGFGEAGQVRIKLPSQWGPSSCDQVAVQPDGKILIGGSNDGDLLLIRLDRDGRYDHSFAGDGVQTTDLTYSETPYALAIQADGKIVVGAKGFDDRTNVLLTVRYGADGELDRGFGAGGAVLAEFPAYRYGGYGAGLAIQSDGKIVLAGSAYGGASASLLLRYLEDGRPDPDFGRDGRVIEAADGAVGSAMSLALQADGKLVTGHELRSADGKRRGTLLRHRSDGSADADFSSPTLAMPPKRLALQADGRIVALGNLAEDVPKPGEVARVDPDGRIDPGFAVGRIDFGGDNDFFSDLALQGDGRILVLAWLADEDRTGLARLHNRTYCLADSRHRGRYLGFSDSGWFAGADGDSGFGVVGRGRARAWQWPGPGGRFVRLSAADAAPGAFYRVDASVFAIDGKGWGLASVLAGGGAATRYALADARLDDTVCAPRAGRD